MAGVLIRGNLDAQRDVRDATHTEEKPCEETDRKQPAESQG